MDPKTRGGLGLNLGAGLLLGLLVGLGGSTLYAQRQGRAARAGWNLVPVLVAAADLGEGTVVTFDDVAQRAVPEEFVTDSLVRPSDANAFVGQRLLMGVKAGDVLMWTMLASAHGPKTIALIQAASATQVGPRLAKLRAADQ